MQNETKTNHSPFTPENNPNRVPAGFIPTSMQPSRETENGNRADSGFPVEDFDLIVDETTYELRGTWQDGEEQGRLWVKIMVMRMVRKGHQKAA
jgi:hypothetical protein